MASDPPLPLPTLLSWALIAFTIELDNEWERRMPYRTTDYGGVRGPWATSLRQWSNFMQWVPEDGIEIRDLTRAARAEPHLDGMRRWGYVTVEGRTVRPRSAGLAAQKVWRPLQDEIEARWRERLGTERVAGLRVSLEPAAAAREAGLPDWLTSFYGGYANEPMTGIDPDPGRTRPLSALLSILLHAFALDFERDSAASLMFTANVLRPVGERGDGEGVPMVELPARSGVAAPALQTAIGILAKRGFVERGTGRGRAVRLTDLGSSELAAYVPSCASIERDWGLPAAVRSGLEGLLSPDVLLWPRIDPPAESWRSRLPAPELLPHHPMPRQGGHPDGV
jgi:hypothetical protein